VDLSESGIYISNAMVSSGELFGLVGDTRTGGFLSTQPDRSSGVRQEERGLFVGANRRRSPAADHRRLLLTEVCVDRREGTEPQVRLLPHVARPLFSLSIYYYDYLFVYYAIKAAHNPHVDRISKMLVFSNVSA